MIKKIIPTLLLASLIFLQVQTVSAKMSEQERQKIIIEANQRLEQERAINIEINTRLLEKLKDIYKKKKSKIQPAQTTSPKPLSEHEIRKRVYLSLKPETPREMKIRTGKLDPGETYPRGLNIFECGQNCPPEFTKEYIKQIEDTFDLSLYLLERRVGAPIKARFKPFYIYPGNHKSCQPANGEAPTYGGFIALTLNYEPIKTFICFYQTPDWFTSESGIKGVQHEYTHTYFQYAPDQKNTSIELMHKIVGITPSLIGNNLASFGKFCYTLDEPVKRKSYPFISRLCDLGFDFDQIPQLIVESRKYEKEIGRVPTKTDDYTIIFSRLLKKDASSVFVELPPKEQDCYVRASWNRDLTGC